MGDYFVGVISGSALVFALSVVMPTGCNCTNPADRRCIYECAQEQMGVVECNWRNGYAVCGANGEMEIVRWSR